MAKPTPSQMLAARLVSALVVTGMLWLLLFLCMPLISKLPEFLERKHLEPYNAAFASGDPKRARVLFDRDLKSRTGEPAAYLEIAAICLRTHHTDLAIEYLERSLLPCKDAPRAARADLYGTLSECYSMVETAKPQEKAILAAQRASELDTASPRWLNAFGYLLADNDIRLDEAVQRTSQALQLLKKSPGDDPTLACMIEDSYGWALYKKGNYDAAVGALNQAIADVPHEAIVDTPLNGEVLSPLYYHLGAASRRQGKTEIARQALQTALKFMPGNKDAKNELDDLNSHSPIPTKNIDSSKPANKPDANAPPKVKTADARDTNGAAARSGELQVPPAAAKTVSHEGKSTEKDANTEAPTSIDSGTKH